LDAIVIFVIDTPFTNGGHGDDFASSVGYMKSDSVGLLVYDGICTISGALVLQCQPCREGVNILCKPYKNKLWPKLYIYSMFFSALNY